MCNDQPRLWRYGMRHLLGLFASTLVLVMYLFFVTLIDGWGSDFGNGLGGGLAILIWASIPTLAVGRRFAVIQGRAFTLAQAARVALPATVLLSGFIIWAGLGMRSERLDVRLSDLGFAALHGGYILVAFGFFTGVLWGRSRLQTHDPRL